MRFRVFTNFNTSRHLLRVESGGCHIFQSTNYSGVDPFRGVNNHFYFLYKTQDPLYPGVCLSAGGKQAWL